MRDRPNAWQQNIRKWLQEIFVGRKMQVWCGFRQPVQDKSGNAASTSHYTTGRVGKIAVKR
jgi:hypothetical protein